MSGLFYARMGFGQLFLGEYEQAIEAVQKAIERNVPPIERTTLAASLAHLGRDIEAQRAREALQAVWPGVTLDGVRVRSLIVAPEYLDRLLSGLRIAGVPN